MKKMAGLKKKRWAGIALLGAMAALGAGAARADSVQWNHSYSDSAKKAQSSGKLLMLEFYTDWCEPCHTADAKVFTNSEVARLSRKFVPVKLNAEKDGVKIAEKYGVDEYPTVIFIRPNGSVVHKIIHYKPADEFSHEMRVALNKQH